MNKRISLGKRIVSIVLTLILAVSMLPTSVFAADGACEHVDISPVDAKCDICGEAMTDIEDVGTLIIDPEGRTAYVSVSTFQEKFYMWEKSAIDKIVLLADIPAGTKDYEFWGDITLDLNGHTLPYIFVGWQRYDEETDEVTRSGSGNLTVCDSVGTGGITEAVQILSSKNANTAPSTLTVEGGIFGTEDGDSATGIQLESGTVNINGGTVWNIGCEGGSGTVNIAGGSVKKISAVNPYYDSETGEEGQYTLNVTGGSGHSGDWNVTGGNWNISGGVFGEITFNDPGMRSQNSFISGGTFEKISTKSSLGSNRNIPLSELLKDGYAFYSKSSDGSDYDKCENAGSVFELNNVSVKSHTHTSVENGVCKECGRACNHNSGKIDYENGKCLTCEKQLEAAVKYKSGSVLGFESFLSALDSVPHNMSEEVTVVLLQDYTLNDTRTLNSNNNIRLDINSKNVSGSGGFALENHSKLTLANGSLSEKITVEAAGGDLTVDADFGNIGTVKVSNEKSKVEVKGGNIENLSLPSIKTEALKNIKLSGGKFGTVKFIENGTVAITDMLEVGYAFKDNKGILSKDSSKLVPYGLTVSAKTDFADLEVVKCEHSAVNEIEGYCNYCGKLYAAKITDKDGNEKYVESLDDWTLILAENCNVKLLQDADRCNVSRNLTFDLNGHHVDTLDLSADGTVTVKGSGSIRYLCLGYNYGGVVKDTTLIIKKPTVGTVEVGFLAVKKSTKTKLDGWSFGQIKRYDSLTLNDLLADGYAIFDKNSGKPVWFSGNDTGAIANYYIDKHDHTFTVNADGKNQCECGIVCDHTDIGENGKCKNCKTQIYTIALITADGTKKNYKTFAEAWPAVAENNGSTLKLLCDTVLNEGIIASSGKFTLDLNSFDIIGNQVLTVSGTADVTVKNGRLINTTYDIDASLIEGCALKIQGGAVTFENAEAIGGYGEDEMRLCSVCVYDGSFTVKSGIFTGEIAVMSQTAAAHPKLKITKATLYDGIEYLHSSDGTDDYDFAGLKAFFADGSMLFDENGKYIDLTDKKYWHKEEAESFALFSFTNECSVSPHTHTYKDGVCSDCGYTCLHDSGKNDREASYFEKAICSVCHAEYGEYAKDTNKPTGKIEIKERKWWESFIHTITFGLFYKEKVKVEITADDDSYTQAGYDETKHAVKIEYLISGIALSEETVKNSAFTEYKGEIDLSDDSRYVVYARLKDFAGNEEYISTDGFVIDTTSPVIEVDSDGQSKRYSNGQRAEVCGDTQINFIDDNFDSAYRTIDGVKDKVWSSPFLVAASDTDWTERWITFEVHDKAGNVSTVEVYVHKKHSFDEETGVCAYCGYGAAVLIRYPDENNEETVISGDSFDEATKKVDNNLISKSEQVKLKLYKDAKKADHEITLGGEGKWIYDLNGHAIINPPTVDPNSNDAKLQIECDIKIIGAGAMNVYLVIGENGSLTVDGNCSFQKLEQQAGTLTVNAGSFESLTILKRDANYSYTGKTTLYGGHYGEIKIADIEGLTCADLLGLGHFFENISYEKAKVTGLNNVTAALCNHEHIDKNYFCTDCGIQFVVSVKIGNTESLFETFEKAIRYAEKNDSCIVKLLRDLTLDDATIGSLKDSYHIYLEKGRYTLDLAGKTLDIINGNEVFVCKDCDLTIGDSVGGGKVISNSGGAVRVGYYTNNNAKLTVTGGEFTVNVTSYNQSALVLEGGIFKKYVVSSNWAKCSPFVYLSDGYTFALIDPAGGNSYANEGNVEVDHDGSQIIRNVTVVPAPVIIPDGGQPQDKTVYLTSPNSRKYIEFAFSYVGGETENKVTVTLETNNGNKVDVQELPAFDSVSGLFDLSAFTSDNSGRYRIKLEFKGCVLYTNTFNITVTECEHPGYDGNNKCTQCGCDLAAAVVKGNTITGYVSFAEALAKAQTEENRHCGLYLFDDVNDEIAVSTGDFYLYMNGHTVGAINVTETGMLDIRGGGTVTGTVTVEKNYFALLSATNVTFNGEVEADGSNGMFVGCTFAGPLNIGGNYIEVNRCTLNGDLNVSGSGVQVNNGSIVGKITVNSGGVLHFFGDDGKYGAALVKAGGTMRVYANSTFSDEVAVENDGTLVLENGTFKKITAAGHLIDCLANDRAFEDVNNGKIIDGRNPSAGNVKVVRHTHTCVWKTDTHEKLCECGYVEATDFEAPVITGIENGKTYYGKTEISVTDDNDFTFLIDSVPVTLVNGKYTITPDNAEHTITAEDIAGNTVTVTVTVMMLYSVKLPTGTGFSVTGETTAGHGTDYEFEVKLADGYSKTLNYKVLVNGSEPDGSMGDEKGDTFLVSNVSGDLNITVEGVADITPPETEANIGTNKFKEFLKRISFGLFFKNTAEVTVKASDIGSGVKSIEYLLSENPFEDKNAVIGDWTELTVTNGKASFSINQNSKVFIYIRVTDESGNIQIVNTDGTVVFTDSEAVTESVDYTKFNKSDIAFDLKLNGNTVKSVFNGSELIDSGYYTVSQSGTVTLKNAYLKTLSAGEYTLRVSFNPMGESFVSGDEPETVSVKLTVEKAAPSLKLKSSELEKEYDGKALNAPDIITDSDGAVKTEYKPYNADDSAYSENAPKNAGKYKFRITVAETADFKIASISGEYEILKKKIKIIGTAVKPSKTYDGKTEAEITDVGALDGLADTDRVTVAEGKANYSDKNAGTAKTVSFTEFAIKGADALNYELLSQPESVLADITAKELKIKNLKVKNKEYDGTNSAKIDGTPALDGLIDGDKLQLLNGVPTFDSFEIGTEIGVSFTDFSLFGDSGLLCNYKLIQPSGIKADIIEYIADNSAYSVNLNGWLNTDFTVTAKSGYKLSLTNSADGVWSDTLSKSDETENGMLEFYVRKISNGAISSALTENYKIDKTVPTGNITLTEQSRLKAFLNKISFGLFFKNDVSVEINAKDSMSGIKSVKYYKSEKGLDLSEIKALTEWTDGTLFDIKAADKEKFIVYARAEDNAGNIAYLSSSGAEFDTAAPVISGVKNGETYYVSKNITVSDSNLKTVLLNRKNVSDKLTLAGDTDAEYTILAEDMAGNFTEYKIYMKPISSLAESANGITSDNVKPDDKDGLISAKESLEALLNECTDEKEEESIKERIEIIDKSLSAIENAKKAEEEIKKLPDAEDIKLKDKEIVEKACERFEKLTQNEKSMIDSEILAKLENALDRISELEKISYSPSIIEGAGLKWSFNSNSDARFRSNAEYDEFVRVLLDGKELNEKYYDSYEGSTVVVLKAEFMKTLSKGEHTLSIVSLNGTASTTFTVEKPADTKSPITGADTGIAWWIALLFVSGGIFTGLTLLGKRKNQ